MKTFDQTVRERYSCRAYSPEIPADSLIDAVLEDARLAPSACNRQPWRFIVVGPDDAAGRKAVNEAYVRDWIASAPIYIVVCGCPDEAWVRPFDGKNHLDIDLAIATEHICLSATAHGLGTCWVCHFDPAVLRAGLELDSSLEPMAIIPIGFPAEGTVAPEKKRKSLTDIVIRR
ncbi:MAG: nitroreductase family protein [Muribaculaceae bacterium]|nr:nitroreductase family protein [Muribaculaceae bacterium]